MTNEKAHPVAAKDYLDRLTASFFRAVSFEHGEKPPYGELLNLFIERGLLIKNSLATPEISSISEFIEPREQLVNSGELTSFKEMELAEITEIFGNVAHRFSTYEKFGTMNGTPFSARGIISTQFIATPAGWKISAMAWDDERPELTIPDHYAPAASMAPFAKGPGAAPVSCARLANSGKSCMNTSAARLNKSILKSFFAQKYHAKALTTASSCLRPNPRHDAPYPRSL